MHGSLHSSCGYGAKYHGLIRFIPNSIISTFFIRVTTSSWWVTMLPDCLGVGGTAADVASSESSPVAVIAGVVGVAGVATVGVATVTGIGVVGVDGIASTECIFRFRLSLFCIAAAITVFPLTSSPSVLSFGLVGRELMWLCGAFNEFEWINFFGVVTPVLWPVADPSLRGNWTFLVSRHSSVTHSSSRLLTVYKTKNSHKIGALRRKLKSQINSQST